MGLRGGPDQADRGAGINGPTWLGVKATHVGRLPPSDDPPMDRTDAPATADSSTTDPNRRHTTTELRADGGKADGPWHTGPDVLEADLPTALREALSEFTDGRSIHTLGDWVDEIRRRTGGGSIAIEQLCHANSTTDHWGEVDGERHHFLCFYDAVILAALVDEPVDVRTTSPAGTVVTATAAGSDELRVDPAHAVFSFGIDPSVLAAGDGEPSLADVYAAVCPYVRAFPDRAAYEAWREQIPAETVAMRLAGATDLAAALVA